MLQLCLSGMAIAKKEQDRVLMYLQKDMVVVGFFMSSCSDGLNLNLAQVSGSKELQCARSRRLGTKPLHYGIIRHNTARKQNQSFMTDEKHEVTYIHQHAHYRTVLLPNKKKEIIQHPS